MSTIKVDTIQTRTGSGNITVSNNIAGNLIGNVTGDITGTHTGNVATNSLTTQSGTTITIPTGKTLVGTDAASIVSPDTIIQIKNFEMTTTAGTGSTGAALEISAGNRPTLVAKRASSKLLIFYACNVWADIDNDSHGYNTVRLQVQKEVNGGGASDIYNQNAIADRGGQSRTRYWNVNLEYTMGAAGESNVIPAYATGVTFTGGRNMNINTVHSFCTLMEIAQ